MVPLSKLDWETVNKTLHSIYGYSDECILIEDTASHLNQLLKLHELKPELAPVLDIWIKKLSVN